MAVLVSDARKVQFVLSVCDLWLLVASESVCVLNSLNPPFGSWARMKYKGKDSNKLSILELTLQSSDSHVFG